MRKYVLGEVEPHRIGRWEYTLNADGSVCIREYLGNRDVLEIPATLMGRPVTSIGKGFHGATYMQLLIIPDTVTTIGQGVCSLAESLQAVWIPEETTDIHDSAFRELENLTIFTPEDSEAHRFAIDHGIPCEPDIWPEMETGDAWITWGDYGYALTPEGEAILREYNGTAGELRLPASLDGHPLIRIQEHAFQGNDFLRRVRLPEGVQEVGHWAFADCPSLRAVTLPEGLEFLGGGAFSGCRDLKSINLPPELDMLHPCTFSGCASLREVTLPQKLRIIFPMAFGCCSSLERLHLNNGLESVVGDPFWKCPKLRRPDAIPDTLDEDARRMMDSLPG